MLPFGGVHSVYEGYTKATIMTWSFGVHGKACLGFCGEIGAMGQVTDYEMGCPNPLWCVRVSHPYSMHRLFSFPPAGLSGTSELILFAHGLKDHRSWGTVQYRCKRSRRTSISSSTAHGTR